MYGTVGEVGTYGTQDEGALGNILGFDGVRDVNHGGLGIDAHDNPFHGRHIGIFDTEVGGQGYDCFHVCV